MTDYTHDFGPFEDGTIWLNCAHQGPLPRISADALQEAIRWRVSALHKLTSDYFGDVPDRLKQALGQLIAAPAEEIIVANSASYGLHLAANGIAWQPGDEVLLVAGDFPSNILPWLRLERQGVSVRYLDTANPLPDADELRAQISPRTRVFCASWVHSFAGYAADIAEWGAVCRERGVISVINASQALGARPLNVQDTPVDFVTGVGFKWLCGPYGTGFCWARPDILREFQFNKTYWLSEITADDLSKKDLQPQLPAGPPTARTYDIFGTANFFNFVPWTASLEYLLQRGIERIAAHDQLLVEHLIRDIDTDKYVVTSPTEEPARSTLVFVSHRDPSQNAAIYARLADAGIMVAHRSGSLRFSPHLHNTHEDIDRALAILNAA